MPCVGRRNARERPAPALALALSPSLSLSLSLFFFSFLRLSSLSSKVRASVTRKRRKRRRRDAAHARGALRAMKRRRSETQRGVGGCGEKRCRRLSRPPLPPPLSLLHASATTLEAALKLLGVPSESQASSDVYVVFDLKAPDLLTWKEQQREGRGSVNGSGCSGNVKLLVEKVIEEKFKCGSTSTSDVLLAGYRRSGVCDFCF